MGLRGRREKGRVGVIQLSFLFPSSFLPLSIHPSFLRCLGLRVTGGVGCVYEGLGCLYGLPSWVAFMGCLHERLHDVPLEYQGTCREKASRIDKVFFHFFPAAKTSPGSRATPGTPRPGLPSRSRRPALRSPPVCRRVSRTERKK